MPDPDIASRFDEIYDSTSKAVLGYITAKCGRTADINDIFQDVYLELYQVLKKRGADYVKDSGAFVMQITKQKLARHYSLMERLRMFVSMTVSNEDGEAVELLDFDIEEFRVEDFAVDRTLLDSAKEFIRSKPEDIKRVFYLYYDLDMKIPEVAQMLGISESNVKNKLYRTLKELRALLN